MSNRDAPTLEAWAGTRDISPSGFELEPEEYMSGLDGLDITTAQKAELLQAMWSIMRSFVDLGFRVDVCGQLFEEFAIAANADSAGDRISPFGNDIDGERQ